MDLFCEIVHFLKTHPKKWYSSYDIAQLIHRPYSLVENAIKSKPHLFKKKEQISQENHQKYNTYKLSRDKTRKETIMDQKIETVNNLLGNGPMSTRQIAEVLGRPVKETNNFLTNCPKFSKADKKGKDRLWTKTN